MQGQWGILPSRVEKSYWYVLMHLGYICSIFLCWTVRSRLLVRSKPTRHWSRIYCLGSITLLAGTLSRIRKLWYIQRVGQQLGYQLCTVKARLQELSFCVVHDSALTHSMIDRLTFRSWKLSRKHDSDCFLTVKVPATLNRWLDSVQPIVYEYPPDTFS